jgi:hypothetical protein
MISQDIVPSNPYNVSRYFPSNPYDISRCCAIQPLYLKKLCHPTLISQYIVPSNPYDISRYCSIQPLWYLRISEKTKKQDNQWTYRVTLWRVRVTSGKVAANIMSVNPYPCLSHSACKSHLLCAVLHCCHMWPLCLSIPYFFPHYSINVKIFKTTSLNVKCVFWLFSTTFVWKIYHSTNNSIIYYHQFS